jgi:hypothetical protein
MAYTISNPFPGMLPIASTDAGIVPPNNVNTGSTTTIPTPPLSAGMIVSGIDPTYGGGEFILLPGCASTIVGSVVRYNSASYATTLLANTANAVEPVAVAMSANTSTTSWGWYQIAGQAVVAKTAVILLPNVAVYVSATAGKVKALASAGLQILGAKTGAATTASASGTVVLYINRPHMQGQIT